VAPSAAGGPAVLACIAPASLASNDINTWAAAVVDVAAPSAVEIAVELSIIRFRSEDGSPTDGHLVRTISTDSGTPNAGSVSDSLTPLRPPNIIDGPAAALLSVCQARGIPARAVVSYRPHGGSLRGADSAALSAFDGSFATAVRAGAPSAPAGDLRARRAAAITRAASAAAGGMMFL
jgi:predicted ATP-grasp superfamily ATP-dependent carboligase